MKFIFVDSFDIVWNGNTARHINGVSGSHSAIMYLAEAIAKYEFNQVVIVSTVNNLIEDTYLNVKYTNFINFQPTECDYIITTNVLTCLSIMSKIVSYTRILIVTHCELYHYEPLFGIDKQKILICYISEFAKRNILAVQPFLIEYDNVLLYNSIDVNDIPKRDIEHTENAICYFACIERGYEMTVEILKKLNNYVLYTNTYADSHRNLFYKPDPNIIMTSGSSKCEILKYVNKSKYFVYPLINLANNCIHCDTFGYVVLEALLCGTIVIAPRIGVYEELYGDAVCYIDTDDIIPNDYLHNWKRNNSNFGYPIIDRYVEKIKLLDSDEELRNSYIRKGLLLKEKFSNTNICNQLLPFLQYLKNPLMYSPNIHLENHLRELSYKQCLPDSHFNYLCKLKQNGFEPKVIYDIGSCVLHWTNQAKKLWPNATYILFDAFSHAEFLYGDYDYYIGVLSNEDNKLVQFYQNDYYPGGNSYYREIGCENGKYFPKDKYIYKITKTLDTIVKEKGFPLPDFVKIDVQGAEVDIIKGGINTFSNAKKMIVELQHTEYNEGALQNNESMPLIENLLNMKCVDPLFTNNGCDGDYCFSKSLE